MRGCERCRELAWVAPETEHPDRCHLCKVVFCEDCIGDHRRFCELHARNRRFDREKRCRSCGEPRVRRRKYCAAHLLYQREKQADLRARRRAEGKCISCEEPAGQDRRYCAGHSAAANARARNRYEVTRRSKRRLQEERRRARRLRRAQAFQAELAARRAAGLCTDCGGTPPAEGHTMCDPCLGLRRLKGRELRRSRSLSALCSRCGVQVECAGRFCDACRRVTRLNARRLRKVAAARGTCADCTRSAVVGRIRCEEHQVIVNEANRQYNARRRSEREPRRAACSEGETP